MLVKSVEIKKQPKLTANKSKILNFLVQQKFATTKQVWQSLQPHKSRGHTFVELRRIENQGLVISFKFEPESGSNGELCWLITKAGANLVGAKFDSTNYKIPSRESIERKGLYLEIENQVGYAGWNFLKPVTYNSVHPMPNKTPQHWKLIDIVDQIEGAAIEAAINRDEDVTTKIADFEEGRHKRVVPLQINDYVIFPPEQDKAFVLIACPKGASVRFWKNRISLYQTLTRKIKVIGVFVSQSHADAYHVPIEASGIKCIEVSQVYDEMQCANAN